MQIEEIIQMAKDHILKHGQYLPKLFVKLDNQEMRILVCPDIVNSEENLEKQHRFFTAGCMLGEDNPETEIASIAFAVEAWVSTVRKDQPRPFKRPSLDPKRRECLIINTLDIVLKDDGKTVEQYCYTVEMIRDGAGKLIDLLPWHHDEKIEVHSTLLTSFLAGFVSTQLSQEQKDDLIAKTLGPDATGEEVRGLSKRIYGRKAHFEVFTLSDIPRKSSKTGYKKSKKYNKK
jgi:hypothetical protein